MKKCTKCLLDKSLIQYPKNKRFSSGYNSICKDCCNLINKNYRQKNSDSFNKMRKNYYKKNLNKMRAEKMKYYQLNKNEKKIYDINYRRQNFDKIKQYKKEWEAINRDNPIFKIKRNLRRRVSHLLNGKKQDHTFELIGCTPSEFKNHIEKQFKDGMTWENYGDWHIDHIIPCFSFNLKETSEQYKCFHYSNQRPLWAKENLSRSRNEFKNKNHENKN